VTECRGDPGGFYIFTYSTADDEVEHVFHGFEGRDRQSGFITAEIGNSSLERTTYRFDYVRDGSGKLRLTGASRADVRAKSLVTGKIEITEWEPLSGALTIFNPGCGFRTFGIENAGAKESSSRKGGRDGR
jgi:hypothetical protein